jgi:hypothetical protein
MSKSKCKCNRLQPVASPAAYRERSSGDLFIYKRNTFSTAGYLCDVVLSILAVDGFDGTNLQTPEDL